MDKILESLTLGTIFRHFLSGAVFVLAFFFAQGALFSVGGVTRLERHSVALSVLALIIGALIYSGHRCVTNPVIEVVRHQLLRAKSHKRLRGFFGPPRVMAMMFSRWRHTEAIKPQASHIYEWGDYIHLQYTTALAVGLGSLTAYSLAPSHEHWHFSWRLWLIGLVFFVGGFYTDCRKHLVEEHCYRPSKPK